MKKFSITSLEIARANPKGFAQALQDSSGRSEFFNMPKSVKWFNALCVYHETSNLNTAITRLEQSFSARKNTPSNNKEVNQLVLALIQYVDEHNDMGLIFNERRISIKIPLSHKLMITGRISFTCINIPTGFSAYFVGNLNTNWQDELRYPVIQHYVSNILYGCPVADVYVGVVDYTSGNHQQFSYSEEEVENALKELQSLGRTITSIID